MDSLRTRQVLMSVVVFILITGQYFSDAVSVRPSPCLTNKIAPRRRLASSEHHKPRTLGHFYSLLSNEDLQQDSPSSLQEEPQEDDPEDCRDIEDYDETDLSSITQKAQRKRGSSDSRFFLQNHHPHQGSGYPNPGSSNYPSQGGNYPHPGGPNYPNAGGPTYPNQGANYPNQIGLYPNQGGPNYPNQVGNNNYHNRPQRPFPVRPTPSGPYRPQRPAYPQSRPPYSSGGVFSDNQYRPPFQQTPSDGLKPVYEGTPEPAAPYRPGVVGGPINHIAGHSPARPAASVQIDDVQNKRKPMRQVVFQGPTANTDRPRRFNNSSVLGSFLDLLFK